MQSTPTSSGLRASNRRRVLQAVYESREISKQGISQLLGLSLPTVTQNLKEFEAMGLIERRGLFDSTGGRKAQIYRFAAAARVAIGVLLLKEGYHIVAADLYGSIVKSAFISAPLSRTAAYFHQFGSHINAFMQELQLRAEQVLGVAIAVQGLVKPGGDAIFYGEVANCTGLTIKDVQAYLDAPCSFIHDTEATAVAELWARQDLHNAVLLVLSRNFGGIFIRNGEPHQGNTLSGTLEHMRLHPGGRDCYCGGKGCVEAYCSSDALLKEAGMPLAAFFEQLRAGDPTCREIWQNYLQDLAMVINNVRMVVDPEFIVSGYLLQFMTEEDFSLLTQYAAQYCPFRVERPTIRRSVYSEDVAACGAAIALVKEYLAAL